MKKKVVSVALSLVIAMTAVFAGWVVLTPQKTEAASPPKYVKVSKKTAKLNIPTNALKKKGKTYYVNTKKLEKIAKNVVKKGKLRFVEYRFGNYKLTCNYPKGTVEGQVNGKGWVEVYLQNSTEYRYFSKKTGVMYKGLKTINGQPRYFNKKTGYLLRNGKVKVNGHYWYFDKNGFVRDVSQ